MWRITSAAAIALLLTSVPAARTARAQAPKQALTAERVQQSIDDAVLYLQKERGADGGWSNYPQWPGAVTSLCVMSLLTAGVPVSDPSVQEPLAILRTIKPDFNYQAAVQTMVFCMAEPEKDLLLIRRNVAYLESQQIRDQTRKQNGSWNYHNSDSRRMGRGDNSNTEFVIEALYEARRVGAPTLGSTWKRAREYWINQQHDDGSWGYVPDDSRATGSMTCAAISSLLMIDEVIGTGDAAVKENKIVCCGPLEENKPVARGLHWLEQNFSVQRNPGDGAHLLYYLNRLERVGRLTNRRLIGEHDWYREGTMHLLNLQDKARGYWKGIGTGESQEVIGTAMALLFLCQGRTPVAAVKHEPRSDAAWRRHRHDLGRLTDYCAKRWKQPLTWQAIDFTAGLAGELHSAPVLYLSMSEPHEFTDADIKILRDYIDAGGFIFAENACGGEPTDSAQRKLFERMFPERDAAGEAKYPLRAMEPDHALFTAEEPLDLVKLKKTPLGIEVDGRLRVVYYPAELGCYWELAGASFTEPYPKEVEETIRAHRSLGINVMAYGTGRRLKNRLERGPLPVEEK